MMILAAIALALQAVTAAPAAPAAPGPTAPAPTAPATPEIHPAVNAAGQVWAQCTRRVVDQGIGSTRTDAELAADAFAGCAAEAAALRAAVAQHMGADAAEPFMTSVTEDARVTILHYLRRTRQPR